MYTGVILPLNNENACIIVPSLKIREGQGELCSAEEFAFRRKSIMKTDRPSILLGITSGIAAYKMLDVVHALRAKKISVRVIMTKHAARMVSPDVFTEASGHPVTLELFPEGFEYRHVLAEKTVEHIQLADSADIFVIAPATANTLAKLAHGIADDVLTTTALAVTCPVLLCPSMNVHMWQHPAVQDNVQALLGRGVFLLQPDEGDLACGYTGVGRLPDPAYITEEILHMLHVRGQLAEKRVIVTAGGTSEPIDGVRTITNNASGKMGYAIAQECRTRGAKVMLLSSHSAHVGGHHDAPLRVEYFSTASDLEALMQKYVPTADILFHTAAVSDFRPAETVEGKLDSSQEFVLRLIPTEKIIAKIKSWNPKTQLVGFKAVYQVGEKEAIRKAVDKMKESSADYIVVNDVGKEGVGFGAEDNEGYVLAASGASKKLDKKQKRLFARDLLDFITTPSPSP